MRRAYRIVLGGLAAAGGAALIVATPRVLPKLPGFEVTTVEVSGTRMLQPGEVLRSSGIRADQSVWDDPETWERALERHPVVESAQVTRRLPGTLRVQVREKEPATWEWVQAFMAATEDPMRCPHLGALACFMFLTGARISENTRRTHDTHMVATPDKASTQIVPCF